ncbi:hypothetical protein PAMA_007708 [Pampus argenteus]
MLHSTPSSSQRRAAAGVCACAMPFQPPSSSSSPPSLPTLLHWVSPRSSPSPGLLFLLNPPPPPPPPPPPWPCMKGWMEKGGQCSAGESGLLSLSVQGGEGTLHSGSGAAAAAGAEKEERERETETETEEGHLMGKKSIEILPDLQDTNQNSDYFTSSETAGVTELDRYERLMEALLQQKNQKQKMPQTANMLLWLRSGSREENKRRISHRANGMEFTGVNEEEISGLTNSFSETER